MAMSADDNGSRRATAPVEDDDHEDDIPDYDDLIESALDSLDVYQARCADMNKHLKNVRLYILHILHLLPDPELISTSCSSPPGLFQFGTS